MNPLEKGCVMECWDRESLQGDKEKSLPTEVQALESHEKDMCEGRYMQAMPHLHVGNPM